MTDRISEALESRNGMVCCRGCGRELAPSGTPWKPGSALTETPVRDGAGAAYGGGERVLLRRFCCPGCGALLDCEIALDGDPFLDDVVYD